MKKISYMLIVIGIIVALIPTFNHWYSTHAQQRLLAEWEGVSAGQGAEAQPANDPVAAVQSYAALDEVFSVHMEEEQAVLDESSGVPDQEHLIEDRPLHDSDFAEGELIGTIAIPKIDKVLPLLEGATEQNMKKSAVHLTGTSAPGEIGNAVIAAHRSYNYGSLFNRLDELETGDEIQLQTNDATYTYEVYSIKIVEPTDVSVLKRNDTDRVLTLITCEPIRVASHRLIVHAVMKWL